MGKAIKSIFGGGGEKAPKPAPVKAAPVAPVASTNSRSQSGSARRRNLGANALSGGEGSTLG